MMELLRCKTRLSVLWVFIAVGWTAVMFLTLMMPDAITQLIAGEFRGGQVTEERMICYSLVWLVPLVMAVLCLTLKYSLNRWLNFILGILVGLLFIYEMIIHSTGGESMSGALWLTFAVGLVVAFFITLLGWKLPEQET